MLRVILERVTLSANNIRQQRPWFTQPQVAEIFQVSEQTIRRMIARGELPAYRVGAQIRIRPEDCERMLRRVPVEVA
jgi:excisionase family DNA binding protein